MAISQGDPGIEAASVSLVDSIEAMADGVMICDAADRVVMWNRRYVEIFPHVADIVRPGLAFRELVTAAMAVALPGLTPEEIAVRVSLRMRQHGRGEARWQQAQQDGRVIEFAEHRSRAGGIVCVYRDVTESRRSAARLAESEARFRDGIESMSDGFVLWDGDDRLVIWNSRFAEMHPAIAPLLRAGMRYDELLASLAAALPAPATRAPREAWLAELVARHRRVESPRDDGLVEGRMIEVVEQRTSAGGIVARYRDVTEERRTLERHQRSEREARRLALVAANTHGAVAILDPESRIEWVNPAFCRLTGYSVEEAIGRRPREILIGPASSPEALATIAEAINAKRPVRVEIAMHRKDGRPFWIELDASPVIGADGRLEAIIGVHVDITERKRHEAELERALEAEREANAHHRRFVAIASHEFRTPLTIIDGAAQRVLRRLLPDQSALREPLDRIRGAVGRMTEIIERTLSTARLDEGQMRLERQRVDLVALLREVAERQRQLSPEFEILTMAVDDVAMIDADPRLLDQILTNLLSNAVKYSGRSRRVAAMVRATTSEVLVEIRDWGLGISPEDRARLFTRFFRARNAIGIPGTGLGLNLVHELVSLHGGTITVASEIGMGTAFTISLPRRIAGAGAAAAG